MELLIVIAIIGILIALLVPGVRRVREAASRGESKNNLTQIILATHSFADARHGRLPTVHGDERGPKPGRSLFAAILPFVDQGAVFNQMRNGDDIRRFRIPVFISPADPTDSLALANRVFALSSYAANAQVFRDNPRAEFNDATPTTQGNPPVSGPRSYFSPDTTFQAAPRLSECDSALAQTPHRSGMLVAIGDGSVRILSPRALQRIS